MVCLNKKSFLQLLFILIPIYFSFVSVLNESVLYLVISVLSAFGIIAVLPICRKRESLWMFLIVAICSLPINLYLISQLMFEIFDYVELFIVKLSWYGLIYCMLLSCEEIIFGIITRKVWRKQYKLKL